MRGCAIPLVVLIAVTAGCATGPRSSARQPQPQSPQSQSPPQPRINLSGFSAAFKSGYADGCESARSLLTRKDGRRFQSDADYAQGWKDGYSICGRRGR